MPIYSKTEGTPVGPASIAGRNNLADIASYQEKTGTGEKKWRKLRDMKNEVSPSPSSSSDAKRFPDRSPNQGSYESSPRKSNTSPIINIGQAVKRLKYPEPKSPKVRVVQFSPRMSGAHERHVNRFNGVSPARLDKSEVELFRDDYNHIESSKFSSSVVSEDHVVISEEQIRQQKELINLAQQLRYCNH
jgi:hypothetical protein